MINQNQGTYNMQKINCLIIHPRCVRSTQIRSKDSQVKTLVLWVFILFKVRR
jgi:hypothetical protein